MWLMRMIFLSGGIWPVSLVTQTQDLHNWGGSEGCFLFPGTEACEGAHLVSHVLDTSVVLSSHGAESQIKTATGNRAG